MICEISRPEIIEMIDDFLEEPNSNDERWVAAMLQIRHILSVELPALEKENRKLRGHLPISDAG